MKTFTLIAILALLSVAFAEDVIPTYERAKTCVKVKTKSSTMSTSATCTKPGRVRTMITFDISVPPVSIKIKLTLKCFKTKRARRVAKRDIKCVKLFMKRCRCVKDEDKMDCIMNGIDTCAPQADKLVL